MIRWFDCFLCKGYGRIDIGQNHIPFFKTKNVICPCCNGSGRLAIKKSSDGLDKDNRRGF